MDPFSLGMLLSGGAQVIGAGAGLLRGGQGGTPDNSTFYQNWRNDDMAWSREQFQRNEDLQREFAQNGVRWRVADATAAGLHPLAAIGAAGSTYSPTVTAGGGNYNVDFGRPDRQPDIGASIASMGQGIGRAVAATQTPVERVETATQMVQAAQRTEYNSKQLQLMDLQIQQAQINLARGTGTGPGMPANVNPNSGSLPDPRPGHTETSEPIATAYRDPYGGKTSLPQKDINIDEISSPGWSSFMYTNRLLPLIDQVLGRQSPAKPAASLLPPGATDWHFAFPGRWIPSYKSLDRGGHYDWSQYGTGRRASTYPMGPSGAER